MQSKDPLQYLQDSAEYNASFYKSCSLLLADFILIGALLIGWLFALELLPASPAPLFCLLSIITLIPVAVLVFILLRWGWRRSWQLVRLIFKGKVANYSQK